jgi:hypothetical protein
MAARKLPQETTSGNYLRKLPQETTFFGFNWKGAKQKVRSGHVHIRL